MEASSELEIKELCKTIHLVEGVERQTDNRQEPFPVRMKMANQVKRIFREEREKKEADAIEQHRSNMDIRCQWNK